MKIGMINAFSKQVSGYKINDSGQKFGQYSTAPLKNDVVQISSNNVSFGKGEVDAEYEANFLHCKKKFTPEAEQVWNLADSIAKRLGNKEITEEHIFLASLVQLDRFIKEIDDGADSNDYPTFTLPNAVERQTAFGIFKDNRKRAKTRQVIQKHIKETSSFLKEKAKTETGRPKRAGLFKSGLKPSKTLMHAVATMNNIAISYNGDEPASFGDNFLFQSVSISRNKEIGKRTREFANDIMTKLMVQEKEKENDVHLTYYDDKADKLWRNLDLGNDMFILYDGENKLSAQHLLSSFTNLINKKDRNYKNLNKNNTEITIMNSEVTFDFVNSFAERAKKDTSKTHIIVVPFIEAIKNASIARDLEVPTLSDEDLDTIANKPLDGDGKSNVRIVFIASKDIYFKNMAIPQVRAGIGRFGQIAIPMLNADDAKDILTDERGQLFVRENAKKPFDVQAIEHSVDVSKTRDGYFPEKAIKFMADVAAYNTEAERITVEDIEKYLAETQDVSKTSELEHEFKISFDTGKKLDDIVGSPMTKAEAKSVVDQILNRTAGTKGITVFLDNGTSYGGGRRHTAEAIAGEAGIPMVTINARDFALKDIDALSQNAALSELKIKKLVSLAKSQAEANKNKSAMIFIENFDNFGSDPVYGLSSIYEQKAFSELLREMENVRKNDNVNLLIVGSTNRPELLDDDIMKPYKFLDKIIIYSPQDSGDRRDVLNYYIDKNGYKIAGETEEARTAIIKNIAETTSYFTVVDLMYLLDKANSVSKERGKEAIDKSDFVEAFLQTTTGRVSTRHQADHDKGIIAAHECGHALTLQIMHDLAEKAEKPWHLPNQVNFITLDPRGDFGGAMFHKKSDNDEYSFETIFADIVCSYGGHSSEKEFYNMDGSWGISADMQNATSTARLAVEAMGLGPKTGRIAIQRNGLGLTDMSERVKNNISDDIELLLKNANLVSNKIVHAYAPFIESFRDKFKDKVGTGECIISAEEFKREFKQWKEALPQEKQEEFTRLENEILEIIARTKKGEIIEG